MAEYSASKSCVVAKRAQHFGKGGGRGCRFNCSQASQNYWVPDAWVPNQDWNTRLWRILTLSFELETKNDCLLAKEKKANNTCARFSTGTFDNRSYSDVQLSRLRDIPASTLTLRLLLNLNQKRLKSTSINRQLHRPCQGWPTPTHKMVPPPLAPGFFYFILAILVF